MYKYRLKYTKLDRMCYIGHLDLIHIFQRAVKRAELPVTFSCGFNPHQEMSFGLPLPLGMASLGEYLDIELDMPCENADIAERLNACLPAGLEVIGAKSLEKSKKSAAALISAASYEVILRDIQGDLLFTVNEIMDSESIAVQKKTKSTLKEVNIKPLIHNIAVRRDSSGGYFSIKTVMSAGNDGYLKPQLFIDYVLERMGVQKESVKIKYTRLDLLTAGEDAFEPLLKNGFSE